MEKNAVFFHEDIYCQVEFVPRENIFYLKKENENISIFGEGHFEGSGYTDMYIREANPVDISVRNISVERFEGFLQGIGLIRAGAVYYLHTTRTIKSEGTIGYNLGRATVFIAHKEETVTAFWIDNFRFHQDDAVKADLKEVLSAIGHEYNLVLNDWDLHKIIDLQDGLQIDKYLNEEFEN